jgi:hypothetical protein
LHNIDCKSIQSIYELALHLAEKPLPLRLPRPVNPRDLEIFRLHTAEKKTIRELANKNGISMKRVWGICTRMRKCGINEFREKIELFSEYLTLEETT